MAGSYRSRENVVRLLTPGLKVKRWALLLLLSFVLMSLAVGYVLRDVYSTIHFPGFVGVLTLQFLPRLTRALLIGGLALAFFGLSMFMLSRSVIAPLLAGGPAERNVVEQMYRYRLLGKGPRVVAIGGGTGLSAMLRGLKRHTGNITAIVTVADDGGSSGRLRSEFRVLPPGDFRQCLTALAETEPLMTELFSHRFRGEGALGGHSFGNLFIMAMAEITGTFERGLQESGRVLAVRGRILPSTLHDVTLCASAGSEVRVGESQVPVGVHPIERVFLEPPNPPLNPEAEAAILDAEMVLIGPGSLYTSILPNLLVEGMLEALRATPAVKVYVCNVASQPGETNGYSVEEHLDAIEQHVGCNVFDYVIVNSNVTPELPPSAASAGANRVTFDRAAAGRRPQRFVLADVVSPTISTHHDPEKLAQVIMKRIWRG